MQKNSITSLRIGIWFLKCICYQLNIFLGNMKDFKNVKSLTSSFNAFSYPAISKYLFLAITQPKEIIEGGLPTFV